MQTSAPPKISRIPGRPTIVLIGPQGCGKTLFAKALAMKFGSTHVIDGENVNGMPTEGAAAVPRDGALVQFTYGPAQPVPRSLSQALRLVGTRGSRIWRNMPPAVVWTFRRPSGP